MLLGLAVRNSGLPLKLFDSSGGFLLPDGSVLSPDAALVRLERWTALSPDQRRGFAPLCRDLVVELASPSDEGPRSVTALRQKMEQYRSNGAQLGWLLLAAPLSASPQPSSWMPGRSFLACRFPWPKSGRADFAWTSCAQSPWSLG